ncbi:MAG: glycosyltransferase family 4 protein [Verrucomicrobiota bacterium]
MKIGFYVQRVANEKGFEHNVSAHVQLPLHTMRLLQKAGHEVQLITTAFDDEKRSLPACLPAGVPVHQVVYGTRQGSDLIMHAGRKEGIRPFVLLKQLQQLKTLARQEAFDVIHLSGGNGIAHLGGLLKWVGLKQPLVLTLDTGSFPEGRASLKKKLWGRLSTIITSTAYFQKVCQENGIPARWIPHGPLKGFAAPPVAEGPRNRVLFWRDPSRENGADLCVESFSSLASRYSDFRFTFAVRPHWDEVPGIDALGDRFSNVEVLRFPYPDGVTIEHLLSESLCVVLPFRELSTHPQFAVMESMLAEAATITTTVGSNAEVVGEGGAGILIPSGDVASLGQGIARLLGDREGALAMGRVGRQRVLNDWNWDGYAEKLGGFYEEAMSESRTK